MATADREATDREREAARGPSSAALPNARLNPLLNPLLAKQLGRWAHIYYTASVDKREAAVEKLVCDLEAEEANLAEAGNAVVAAPAAREGFSQNPVAPPMAGPVLVTSQHLAPPPPVVERRTLEPQGGAPPVMDSSAFANSPGVFDPRAEHQPASQPPAEVKERDQSIPESVPQSWHELLRRAGSSPQEDQFQEPHLGGAGLASGPLPAQVPAMDGTPAQNHRSLDDLLAKSDATQMPPPPARRWRSPLIAAGVAALLSGWLWIGHINRPHPAVAEQASPPQKPAIAPPVVAVESPAPTPAVDTPPVPPVANAKPSLVGAENGPGVHHVLVQTPQPADHTPPSDPELAAGMRSLQGTGVARNSAEAAHHLWQSVRKQNGSALVVLAGLYAQGDGVAKDCDQAKILLDAAARQAKSHTQFQHVETARASLRTSGCE